jgi:uncharacterized protein YndB with AHSA1/START domain
MRVLVSPWQKVPEAFRSIMLRVLVPTILVVVIVVAAILSGAAVQPDTFRVQRSTSIKAPPEKIFPLINDFRRWAEWSPYEKLDPTMKRSLSSPASGKGAVYEWDSNGKAGKGRMKIVDTAPLSRIRIELDFQQPFETRNTVDFTLESRGDSTVVTWVMWGPNLFVGKVMSMFKTVDDRIGQDLVTGLARLKSIAEQ